MKKYILLCLLALNTPQCTYSFFTFGFNVKYDDGYLSIDPLIGSMDLSNKPLEKYITPTNIILRGSLSLVKAGIYQLNKINETKTEKYELLVDQYNRLDGLKKEFIEISEKNTALTYAIKNKLSDFKNYIDGVYDEN